jgi:hypothetical protein
VFLVDAAETFEGHFDAALGGLLVDRMRGHAEVGRFLIDFMKRIQGDTVISIADRRPCAVRPRRHYPDGDRYWTSVSLIKLWTLRFRNRRVNRSSPLAASSAFTPISSLQKERV